MASGTVPSLLNLMSLPVREWFLTLAPVTEFFFSCLEPTEFLPSWTAAKAVAPLSRRKRQMDEMTFA